ncbi:MAG: penicillin acylase family protein [Verrucomicrobiota bacterium]
MSVIKQSARLGGFLLLLLLGGCATLKSPPKPATTAERIAAFEAVPQPDLRQEVTVYWNDAMVPYVVAEDDLDAAIMLGMIHAHLRLAQMELGKRVAYARISEMIGPPGTEIDAALRAVGITRAVDEIVANMPPDTRAWLQAYADGVNHYKASLDELPHSMQVLAMEDEPWRVQDSVALTRLAGVDVNWLTVVNLLPERQQASWPEIWERVTSSQDGTLPSFSVAPETAKHDGAREQVELMARLLGPFSRTGSNSFAVTGARSITGAPLIANDPHLGFLVPNLWLIAGLKSPSYHAVGMMPVGIPVIAFGRNADLAWGGTNMRHEASDFVDVTGTTDTFSETHQIKRRLLWDVEATNRVSPRYGPIISDAEILDFPEGKDIALRWVGHLPSDEITAMLKVARATSWQELYQALHGFALPGQNFVFADTQGNVGQILAAWIPARYGKHPDDLWISPQESDEAWQDIHHADRLPFIVNPPDGVIASANNKPVDDAGIRISWIFASDDRIRRLYDRLGEQSTWSVDDFKALQKDVYSPSHDRLARAVVTRARNWPLSDEARLTLDSIAAWDGYFDQDSHQAYIYNRWLAVFAPQFYVSLGQAEQFDLWKRGGYLPRYLLKDMNAMEDEALRPLLVDSLDQTGRSLEPDTVWGDVHRIKVQHLLGNVPLIGGAYQFGERPVGGHNATVFKTSGNLFDEEQRITYGSQSRHISDLSDINANYFVLFGGQDGQINAENATDQVDLWERGEFVQVPFEVDRVKETFAYRSVFPGRR